MKSLSRVWLFGTPWTVAYQAPPSMGFSRQEYWSGLPFPSPGNLPNPGIEPRSPAFQADALTSEPPGKPKSRGNWGWKFIICQGPNTGFPGGASGKEFACQCRRHRRRRFNPWIGKIPWRRACNPLQCYCLENSTGRGAWWAAVHGVTISWTWLSD